MTRNFVDFFRCPEGLARFDIPSTVSADAGYFRFGDTLTCYGTAFGVRAGRHPWDDLGDALSSTRLAGGQVRLPFDPDQAADNLRYERYPMECLPDANRLGASPMVRDLYYVFRPLMPVSIRSVLQRAHLRGQLENPFPSWPVDRTVDRLFETLMELQLRANGNDPIPFIWFWPEGKRAALVITHDVESAAGVAFSPRLMDLDSEYGFSASFQIVPEKRYDVPESLLQEIRKRGFEINVHDLNHDGNLFRDRDEFRSRAAKINSYAAQFGARGFRAGALYRRLDWFDALNVSYDMSVPNVAHLDPQNGGCCTVMPYFVGDILELPVTATQDYSMFHILKQYSIDLWREQAGIIIKGNGLINIITHPDYLIPSDARNTYRQLLAYLAHTCVQRDVWAALPGEINRWWRLRRDLRLVRADNRWQICGEGCERARLAYAALVDGKLAYTLTPAGPVRQAPYAAGAKDNLVYSALALDQDESTSVLQLESSPSTRSAPVALETITQSEEHAKSSRSNGAHSTNEFAPESTRMQPPFLDQSTEHQYEPASSQLSKHDDAKKQRQKQKPLRVCMVAYTFYEADNRVMRYAETLAQEGHEVEVLALQQGDNPREEVICGVRVHRLQSRVVNEKNQLSYAWRIWMFLLRALVHVTRNDWQRRYDLIHVHSVPDFLVFSALIPRLRGTPVILDIHDILPEFYLGKFGGNQNSWVFRLLTFAERMCANTASHVIIANHIWRDRLISRSVTPDRCTVVLNSPDRSIFHPSSQPRPKNDRFLLLYPGTLNWHQGLDIAIRAFGKIAAKVPNADFHIYGEGPAKPFLNHLIQRLGLQDRVCLLDSRRIREIALIMEQADLGVVPKRKDTFGNEAFSTKIFEFMAMRVPVIVSDTRIDQFYFNDSLVRFFKGGDEDDLAQAMLDLIRHPEKRSALVSNASDYIVQNDWMAKKHEYLGLVARLTAKRAALWNGDSASANA